MTRSSAPDAGRRREAALADLAQRALETEDVHSLLRAVVNAVDDAIDADAFGVFECADEERVRLRAGVGWPDDAVGDLVVPATEASTIGRALDADRPVVVEAADGVDVPAPVADGGTVSTLGTVVSADGEPWGVIELRATEGRAFDDADAGFLTDVADVLASALTTRSQSQLEEVYGRISDAFFALDEEWRFSYLNERAHELINPEGAELVGKNVWEAFPEAISRKFESEYEHAMYEQESVTFEEYYPEPLDAWFEVSAYPSETGLSVYFQDVTERKEIEQELRESEARFRMLAEELDEVVWMATADANEFVYVNPAFQEIWGMSVDALYEEPMSFVDGIHPEDRDRARAGFESLPEEDYDEEFRIVPPDGEIRWIHARGTLATADGEMERIVGIGEDVTEHKRREERLEELVEELERSNERLEQFAYAASHDLQEPLRMVSSYLMLVEDRYADELDAEGREFIEYAVDGADRMREMIRGLLRYSRVETEGEPLEAVDLDAVVDAVRMDLRVRIEESDAAITVESLPTVLGDEGQLRQVFQNLIDNAIEYSGDEAPVVHIDAERTDGRWAVTVSDEGIGIDPDEADRVFDVFERLHAIGEHRGTGIGLALCERIVERHGGEIWVDSAPGEGAAFTFTLSAVE